MEKNIIQKLIDAKVFTHKDVEDYLDDYNKEHGTLIARQEEQGQSKRARKEIFSRIENGVLMRLDERDLDKNGNYKVPLGVHRIGEYAFSGYDNINMVIMGDRVKTISAKAFYQSGIRKIDLNKVERIARLAFAECENLEEIKLSSKLKYAGDGVFLHTKSLNRLIEPSGNVIKLKYRSLESEKELWKYINKSKEVVM